MQTLQIGDQWPSDQPGGLNSYYADLLRHLPAHHVFSRGLVVGTESVSAASSGSCRSFARPDAPLLARLMAARRAAQTELRNGSIDMIAVHFALYGMPLLDRLKERPTVIHFHGPWASESGREGSRSFSVRVKRKFEENVYRTGRRLIVLSEAFRREITTQFGITDARVRVIPGGVDIERFHPAVAATEARSRLGWPDDRRILLSVRRLVRRMGLENLIEAVSLLAAQRDDFVLFIGGSGPLEPELRQRIRESSLEHRVRLLGRLSDEELPIAYQAADLTLVPSQALEGFGLTVVESLACGTPVCATPVGGLPEILRPFAPQCIFRDTSVAAIAEMLGTVLRDPSILPSREQCRAYAVESFSWRNVSARVAEVYGEALT
jgi:glycosyltransferase involved in cell wall biosynthesis